MPDTKTKGQAWFQRLRGDIIDHIPGPVVFALASPYLAGTTGSTAIEFAHQQYQQAKMSSTLDILGESSITAEQCDQAVDKYLNLLDEVYANPLPVNMPMQQISVSLKPSTFSTTTPSFPGNNALQSELDDAYSRIESIAVHAQKLGINITIEAEEHTWTDFQLDCYFSLVQKGYLNLGTVLQSRLFRTEQDIKKFDEKMRVRLVIGIYDESKTIALTDKKDMKHKLAEYGFGLAERGTYVEFATHDAGCIEQFVRKAVIPLRLTKQKFEFQFLKGVPRQQLQTELVSGGATVRLYVPFGEPKSAAAYCKRRLKENPSIILYGLKNLLHLQ